MLNFRLWWMSFLASGIGHASFKMKELSKNSTNLKVYLQFYDSNANFSFEFQEN